METLSYQIFINASPEKVWQSMWQPENYKIWTIPFCNGTYYKTNSFTEGSSIQFLIPSGDGMYSIIDKLIPNKFMAFRHLGDIKNFKEIPTSENADGWKNALETYTLNPQNSGTELIVNADSLEGYIDFMNKTFPLALLELKKIAEA